MPDIPFYGDKWRGIGAPLKGGANGVFTFKYTKELVLSSLLKILTTHVGTRLMRPAFGSVFPETIFEQNDSVLKAKIEIYMRGDIARQEPRIDKLSVSASQEGVRINVRVSYEIRETGEKVSTLVDFEKNKVESIKIGGIK